jgi:hypothetical protein
MLFIYVIVNKDGMTAFDWAKRQGRPEIVTIIEVNISYNIYQLLFIYIYIFKGLLIKRYVT